MEEKEIVFTQEENIKYYRDSLERDLEWTKRQLRQKCVDIIEDLELVVKKIDNGDIKSINSLGELQGRSSSIDRLCGELGKSFNHLSDFNQFFKQEDSDK